MRRKNIATLIVLMLVAGLFLYAASGKMFIRYSTLDNVEPVMASTAFEAMTPQQPKSNTQDKRMVDMTADDSYLIEKGDSTIFILVGHFAAHHNGAVIIADSAVRYSNQSFECFGNVLINQNSTYIYGERAEYNRMNNTAKVYSKLVKVVDEDAVMYTYHCEFNTAQSLGEFSGGCYVEKGENLLEADRGYYNTKTHELKAVRRVQMRDDTYEVISDSVIFNTQTEDAEYFTNTHIWNKNDEYLYADAGTYTKRSDLHHLTRNAYILSPEREIWSDTVMYYRNDGHIIARRNIQVDDTTQKVLGYADYAEWWDIPGNAFFTRRPSLINYDFEGSTDSVYLSADTLWMYTIPVRPEPEVQDTTSTASNESREQGREQRRESEQRGDRQAAEGERAPQREQERAESAPKADAPKSEAPAADRGAKGEDKGGRRDKGQERGDKSEARGRDGEMKHDPTANRPQGGDMRHDPTANRPQNGEMKPPMPQDSIAAKAVVEESDSAVDTLAADSTAVDTMKYTPKQLRRRAKMAKKAEREQIKAAKQAVQDSINAIEQARKDSIKHINDSLLRIKIDTIIAERIARSSRLADEEAARIARIKQKAEQRRRNKIDKAKARALKRGREYTGEDYDPNDSSIFELGNKRATDTTAVETPRDTTKVDSLMDSVDMRPVIPADSAYKMIKAYRRVKMFRSESQMICDSLVTLNTDSVVRMYINPVMWNESNQIKADSSWIYTERQKITKAHFMGSPIMGSQIDTACYNQVKGKDMKAYFRDGEVYRYDVDGNAQTLYYMQEEDAADVTAMMYIESSAISFYLDEGQMDHISFKQNPEYVLYPMNMIPDTQERILQGFEWNDTLRPTRRQICNRAHRSSRRVAVAKIQKPTFPTTERINYDRRRLVENRAWKDRRDRLSPDVIEWRNACPSYKNRRK